MAAIVLYWSPRRIDDRVKSRFLEIAIPASARRDGSSPQVAVGNRWVVVHRGCIAIEKSEDDHTFWDVARHDLPLIRAGAWGKVMKTQDGRADWVDDLRGAVAFARIGDISGITVGRGRFGERPMYFAKKDGGWIAASELAMLAAFDPRGEVDQVGWGECVWNRWNEGARTIVAGVHQVLPGHVVQLTTQQGQEQRQVIGFDWDPDSANGWQDLVEDTRSALNAVCARAAQVHDSAVVMLSGGVDSSLILAIARGHFRKLTAVTPRWSDGANPEFSRAVAVADILGVKHRQIELDAAVVRAQFPLVTARFPGPIRRWSSLAIAECFQRIGEDAQCVLYGEAADTLFGYDETARMRREVRRKRLLMQLPRGMRLGIARLEGKARSARLRTYGRLVRSSELELFAYLQAIEYSTRVSDHFPGVSDAPTLPRNLAETVGPESELSIERRTQLLRFGADVADYLKMLDHIAAPLPIELLNVPTAPEVVDVATRLPISGFFDKKGYSKPILRYLAAEVLPRDWVYSKVRRGFPTPNRTWLSGPLEEYVRAMNAGLLAGENSQLFGSSLAALDPDEHPEEIWTALTLTAGLRHLGLGASAPV